MNRKAWRSRTTRPRCQRCDAPTRRCSSAAFPSNRRLVFSTSLGSSSTVPPRSGQGKWTGFMTASARNRRCPLSARPPPRTFWAYVRRRVEADPCTSSAPSSTSSSSPSSTSGWASSTKKGGGSDRCAHAESLLRPHGGDGRESERRAQHSQAQLRPPPMRRLPHRRWRKSVEPGKGEVMTCGARSEVLSPPRSCDLSRRAG